MKLTPYICIFLLLLLAGFLRPAPIRDHPPGQVASREPIQSEIDGTKPWLKEGYLIRPLARFSLTARALLIDHYYFDRESALSPVDVTFGWGPMSDSAVLNALQLSHGYRNYRWRAQALPIAYEQINAHAANMHLIPADEYVKLQLKKIIRGDLVSLEGYLIEAAHPDGFNWRSSLTRNDSGHGACEVVWVDKLSIR